MRASPLGKRSVFNSSLRRAAFSKLFFRNEVRGIGQTTRTNAQVERAAARPDLPLVGPLPLSCNPDESTRMI